MDGKFIPDGLGTLSPWYINLFENITTIQFNHRMVAYLLAVVAVLQFLWVAKSVDDGRLVRLSAVSRDWRLRAGCSWHLDAAGGRAPVARSGTSGGSCNRADDCSSPSAHDEPRLCVYRRCGCRGPIGQPEHQLDVLNRGA